MTAARIHTWGCDKHKEDTYEGCATCDLEDFSELSSKLMAANAQVASLKELIDVYARHRSNCLTYFGRDCTCGWEQKRGLQT